MSRLRGPAAFPPPLAVALSLAMVLAGSVQAQLSPGPLHRTHEELEGLRSCTRCHALGRGLDETRCLECHTAVADRIRAGSGLHGREDVTACERCHVDHQGREFDLVHWPKGMDAFDHVRAGYRVRGAHADLECRSCHRAALVVGPDPLRALGKDLDRTFLGLATTCESCHEDAHEGQLAASPAASGPGCEGCHEETAWHTTPGFDHVRSRFPLRGEHGEVACAECHPADRDPVPFVGIPFADCASCHRDPHRGALAGACATCHDERGWHHLSVADFDHGRTRYPLEGRHRDVACAACHGERASTGTGTRTTLAFDRCTDCHVDDHRGELVHRADGGACEGCHSVEGFEPSHFTLADHAAAGTPLEGAHRAVPCYLCHATDRQAFLPAQRGRFRFEDETCTGCHVDPHGGEGDREAAGCRSCHDVDTWHEVRFDHARTAFALEGVHADATCRSCHERADGVRVIGFAGVEPRCAGCHADVHGGQFGADPDCASCHGPRPGWPSHLDHDHTRFPLDGAHAAVPCTSCHLVETIAGGPRVRYRPLPTACEGCHGATIPGQETP